MATITLTFPDAVAGRVVDALCANGGRPSDSPVTKPQFAKQEVANYILRVVRQYEAQQASDVARKAADDKAVAEVAIA